MKINYWKCQYSDYQDGVEEGDKDYDSQRIYGCTHPRNHGGVCICDNQWSGDEADCILLDINQAPQTAPPEN